MKVCGVKLGKEINGKHVNTQIVFFADRDKIICHFYNTTQLNLVNGQGYRKFIDLFLKPFLESKVNECLEDIENFNDEVARKLGPKTVKRSDIKLKRGPAYPCPTCDFAAKSVAALRKHKKTEHIMGLSTSNKSPGPRQSTRNNSVVEQLMIEDVTVTDLDNESNILIEERSLKYTCNDCNYITTNKAQIDDHIKNSHLPCETEEVRFICIICKHEFKEAEDYESHVQMHDREREKQNMELYELENIVFSYILEYHITENLQTCHQCDFKTETEGKLNDHMQTMHHSEEHENEISITEQSETGTPQQEKENAPGSYKCNLCEFKSDCIDLIWNHKLDKHTGESFNFNKLDKDSRKNVLFNILAEQNVDLIEEVTGLRNSMKERFKQMIDDFEDGMQQAKDESTKQNSITNKAITSLHKKIDKLYTATNSDDVPSNGSSESETQKASSTKPSNPLSTFFTKKSRYK